MKTIHALISIPLVAFTLLLTSCTKDFCEDTACLNGGECYDGQCNCTQGYAGSNCAQQVTPDVIRIRAIELTQFPGLNKGATWDETDGPDLYFRLYEGDKPLSQPLIDLTNASDQLDYFFFIEIIDLRNVFSEHTIQLRDYDPLDEDDILGEVKFIPYHETNAFPQTMVLHDGGTVTFNIELEYFHHTDAR